MLSALLPESSTTNLVLTTGATSPCISTFSIPFSGPSRAPLLKDSPPPESSPPVEEDIADPPALPSIVIVPFRPQEALLTLPSLTFDQIRESALSLAQNGSYLGHQLPGVQPPFTVGEFYSLMVTFGLPASLTQSVDQVVSLLHQFVQPAIVHHHLTLGHLLYTIAGLTDAFTVSQSRFQAYQDWAHELFSLITNNQRDSLSFQNHIGLCLNLSVTLFLHMSVTASMLMIAISVLGEAMWNPPLLDNLMISCP